MQPTKPSTARGGRPRVDDPRIHQVNVSLTASEAATLLDRATRSNMKLVAFSRMLLLAEEPPPTAEELAILRMEEKLYSQLRRLGANLNQIAHRLNAYREPAPPGLAPLLHEIRAILNAGFSHDR